MLAFRTGHAIAFALLLVAGAIPAAVTPRVAAEEPSLRTHAISTKLEQFVTNQSVILSSTWAGSRLIGDDQVEVGLTTDDVPPALRRPEIVVVRRLYSTERLDQTMTEISDRLNGLLARGMNPGTSADWPYTAHVNNDANVIDVQLADEADRAQVEHSLAREIADRRVRVIDGA